MYTVTRQVQWPGGDPVVEVSRGGIDYINPDALSPKYEGEMEEYLDPWRCKNRPQTALDVAKGGALDGPGSNKASALGGARRPHIAHS